VGLAIACVCSFLAIKKPSTGVGLAGAAFVGGAVAAIALRAIMWLIGSPVMDFFLMPFE
jgi:anaerobic dimethyl sulfoxide reductase subunit C (anchor subunit)